MSVSPNNFPYESFELDLFRSFIDQFGFDQENVEGQRLNLWLAKSVLEVLDTESWGGTLNGYKWESYRGSCRAYIDKLTSQKVDEISNLAADSDSESKIRKAKPIAVAMMRSVPSRLKSKHLALKRLLLEEAFQSPKNQKKYKGAADELSKFPHARSLWLRVIELLPSADGDGKSYRADLSEFADHRLNESGVKGSEQNFLKQIVKLASLTGIKAKDSQRRETPAPKKIKPQPKPPRKDKRGVTQVAVWPYDDEVPTTVASIRCSAPNDEPELSRGELDGRAAKSARWLSNSECRTSLTWEVMTRLEQQALAEHIKSCIASEDAIQRRSALVMALVYLTGQPVDQALGFRVATDGDITQEGLYRRKIVLPENVHLPEHGSAPLLTGVAEAILLKFPNVFATALSEELFTCGGSGTLGEMFSLSIDDVTHQIKRELELLRARGMVRVKLAKLTTALPSELDVEHRLPLLTYLIAGSEQHRSPVLGYYVGLEVSRLRVAFHGAACKLFNEVEDLSSAAQDQEDLTLPVPNQQSVIDFSSRASSAVLEAVADKKLSLAERHNAYTDYVINLLMFATLHRPVLDPFCRIDWISTDYGWTLVSDKVSQWNRRFRLVALPPMAVQQLRYYYEYLRGFGFVVRNKGDAGKHLNAKIQRLFVEPELGQAIPLFFHVDENFTKVTSIDRSSLSQYTSRFWNFPPNYHRRIQATELAKRRVSPELIQLQLGHGSQIEDVFGATSTLSPNLACQQLASHMEEILVQQGWKAIAWRPSRKKVQIDTKIVKGADFQKIKLGPDIRQEERRVRRAAIAKSAEAEANEIISCGQHEDSPPTDLDDRVTRLAKSAAENGISPQFSTQYLVKNLNRLGSKDGTAQLAAQHRFLSAESSPLKEDSPMSYAEFDILREAFSDYLQRKERGFDPIKPTIETRLAEIIISAAVYSFQSDPVILKKLPTVIVQSAYSLSEILFIDLFVEAPSLGKTLYQRWLPDQRSSMLILGLHRLIKRQSFEVDNRKIFKRLKELLSDLTGEKVRSIDLAIRKLRRLAKAGALFELPGYLRSNVERAIPSAPFSVETLVRLSTKEKLASRDNAQVGISQKSGNPVFSVENRSSSEGELNLKEFIRALGRIARQSNATAKGYNKYRQQQKRHFAKQLRGFVEGSSNVTPSGKIFCFWILKLLTHGTSHQSDLAMGTVDSYRSDLKPLLRQIYDLDLFCLSESQFEDLYSEVADSVSLKDPSRFIRQIISFHEFLVDQFAVPNIDWTEVFKDVPKLDSSIPRAEANLVTGPEYDAALSHVLCDANLDALRQLQYAGLLILGYRFGLRAGEIFRLRHLDLRIDQDTREIELTVTSNVHGEVKTKAGRRWVPLLEKLTEKEWLVLTRLVEQTREFSVGDKQGLLMGHPNEYRETIDRAVTSLYVNQLLTEVSGDPDLRIHHMRHGFLTRVAYSALVPVCGHASLYSLLKITEPTDAYQRLKPELQGVRRLKVLCRLAGHSHERQTLVSYIHITELVAHLHINLPLDEADDLTVSYGNQVPLITARQRRLRRTKKKQVEGHLRFYSEKINGVITECQISTVPRPQALSVIQIKQPSITLNSLDRILQLNFARDGKKPDGYISSLGVAEETFDVIIGEAKGLEIESSFQRYSLNGCQAYAEKSRQLDAFRGQAAFAKALNRVLPNIERHSDVQEVQEAFRTWSQGYVYGQKAVFINKPAAFRSYISGLLTLHNHEVGFIIQYTLASKAFLGILTDEEKKHCSFQLTEQLPKWGAKPGYGKNARVVVSITRISESVALLRQLDRIHFLTALWLRLRGVVNVSPARDMDAA